MLRHIKWFTDPTPYPTRYDLIATPPVLAAVLVALGALLAAWWIARTFPEPRRVRILERFAGLGPLALRLHVGLGLVAAAIAGLLFVPVLRVPADNTLGFAILTIEAMCGLLLVAGLATRAAAALLALLGVVAIFVAGVTFEAVLEQAYLLGIAAFLFLVGRGRMSPAWALGLVRVAMGFAIAYTALTEKLLDPPLAQALLDARPDLNFLRGLGLADGQFVWLAGVAELAIGCVIVSPWATRPAMIVGAVLFTATLPLFGWGELLGHLPFYGVMFLFLFPPRIEGPLAA